jgi:ribosome maturation factor RimP
LEKGEAGMSKRQEYETRTEKLLLPILERLGFELYDLEYVKEGSTNYLRAYIDKPGGIAVNDCETVAREMNPILDEEDYIEDSYVFEVSSPGLGRPLKKDKHLEKSIGEQVEIHTFRPINHEKQFFGSLKGFDADRIFIEDEEGNEHNFARTDIALIRLALDF